MKMKIMVNEHAKILFIYIVKKYTSINLKPMVGSIFRRGDKGTIISYPKIALGDGWKGGEHIYGNSPSIKKT
jgi:hypothetical protein